MKKTKVILVLLICFFCTIMSVKADEQFQYCQYDIKDGKPYVIGTCNHMFKETQDHTTLAPNGCSYQGNEHYELIGANSVYNSSTNQECPNYIIFDGSDVKLFANRENLSNGNSPYTYKKKYNSGGYYYFNYIYYCKVGSNDWCKPPMEGNEKYYSVVQEAEMIEENNQTFTELRCFYGNDYDNPIYCNTSTGKCMTFNDNDMELYVNANIFMTEGHYYCPKVKITNDGVHKDITSQLFSNSQQGDNSNDNQKFCNYPILKDSNGNEYEFKLSYYLDQEGNAKSVTPTLNCRSGSCTMNFRGYLDNNGSDLGVLLKNCYNNQNYRECPRIKLDEKSKYLEVEYCISTFNSGGTSGQVSDNPSTGGNIIPGEENDKYSNIEKCTDVDVNHIKACGCIPAEVADITSKVYFILRLIGPIILLIIGGFEMAKAVASQDESSIEKAKKKLVNKFIAAAAIFLVLTIIKLGVSLVADNTTDLFKCIDILLDGYVI